MADRFAAYRDAVNDQEIGLLDICRQEDLVLVVDTVYYISHWITPELAPRRYDTRFFITSAPPGQTASHDDGETIATIWVRPRDALALEAQGDIELLPPTIANLKSIEGFRSTGEVMAWASQVTDVTTVLPIVLIEDGHVLILRPGDDGYVEALADRRASGGPSTRPWPRWPGRPGAPSPIRPEPGPGPARADQGVAASTGGAAGSRRRRPRPRPRPARAAERCTRPWPAGARWW